MERKTDFDPQNAAKKLLREGRSGALATLMAGSGDPYCSLVNVATAADGAPLLLLSRLALHTKNILADPRVSLMIDERKTGDIGSFQNFFEIEVAEQQSKHDLDLTDRAHQGDVGDGEPGEPACGSTTRQRADPH